MCVKIWFLSYDILIYAALSVPLYMKGNYFMCASSEVFFFLENIKTSCSSERQSILFQLGCHKGYVVVSLWWCILCALRRVNGFCVDRHFRQTMIGILIFLMYSIECEILHTESQTRREMMQATTLCASKS